MRVKVRKRLGPLARDRRGATAIEYGLVAALITLAAIGSIGPIGGKVLGFWQKVDNAVAEAN